MNAPARRADDMTPRSVLRDVPAMRAGRGLSATGLPIWWRGVWSSGRGVCPASGPPCRSDPCPERESVMKARLFAVLSALTAVASLGGYGKVW